MDKRVIFASAGSGKTTYIVNSLTEEKRFLVVTYTVSNYENLSRKISDKFNGMWPENITLMTYFQFLFRFCYKPFFSDRVKARGIIYNQNIVPRIYSQNERQFYLTADNYFYSCRLSLFIQKYCSNQVINRISKYFDVFIIDEVQDIAGRDFNFLEILMNMNIEMLFVGDFYQHTFDTSRDGNVNHSLFDDRVAYEARFTKKGFISDTTTLNNSWRCGVKICDFISSNLRISISSNRKVTDSADIIYVSDPIMKDLIIQDSSITKLHYQEYYKYGPNHRNWGDTKGEDSHVDVCVLLNKHTSDLYSKGKLHELKPSTRNKLYVAITRAHRNVYLINE